VSGWTDPNAAERPQSWQAFGQGGPVRPPASAEPQPSRPTRPFGAPDIGTDTITSNPESPMDGDGE
jgi:hypothetical protein